MVQLSETVVYLTALTKNVVAYPIEKVLLSSAVTAACFLFDKASFPLLGGLLVLIVFDFITGLVAAKTTGVQITSAKVSRSALKVVWYGMLISGAHLAGNAAMYVTLIDDITLGFLAITELISIMENIGKMGYCTPQKLLNSLEEYTANK